MLCQAQCFPQPSNPGADSLHNAECGFMINEINGPTHMGWAIMPPMTKDEAIAAFGSQVALAKVLGMKQSSISTWGRFPPVVRQFQIERLTNGALLAEPSCDEFRPIDDLPAAKEAA